MESPSFQKEGKGALGFFKECGKPIPSDKIPAGVRAVSSVSGNRAGMLTCTVTTDIPDPIAAFGGPKRAAKESHKLDAREMPNIAFERLENGLGYRVRGAIEPPQPRAKDVAAGPGADVGSALAVAMFANRYLTITIAGPRIERSNGELATDNKSTTWKIPLTSIISPVAMGPINIEADIITAESWVHKWKRTLRAWLE